MAWFSERGVSTVEGKAFGRGQDSTPLCRHSALRLFAVNESTALVSHILGACGGSRSARAPRVILGRLAGSGCKRCAHWDGGSPRGARRHALLGVTAAGKDLLLQGEDVADTEAVLVPICRGSQRNTRGAKSST
jgi:hypothetical protein